MEMNKAPDIMDKIDRRGILQYSYFIEVQSEGEIDIEYNKLPEP